jgi:AmmeMemoRadiSam system protein B
MERRLSGPSAFVAGGLVVLMAMCLVTAVRTTAPAPLRGPDAYAIPVAQQPTFYDEARWHEGQLGAAGIVPDPAVAGIVVPHHLLAARVIGGMFARAASDEVRLVVVVGPNHDQVGPYPIATMNGAWATPFGEIATDPDALTSLELSTGARDVPEAFVQEHAAGAMMPFVATYFPNANVVTVLLRTEAGEDEARRVDEWLATLDPATTRVVYSIDFSHYLAETVASRRDDETLAAMRGGDLAAVALMDNGHVDSRATLMTAMLMAERLGGRLDEVAYHGNSNDFGVYKTTSTTSYFGIPVRRK